MLLLIASLFASLSISGDKNDSKQLNLYRCKMLIKKKMILIVRKMEYLIFKHFCNWNLNSFFFRAYMYYFIFWVAFTDQNLSIPVKILQERFVISRNKFTKLHGNFEVKHHSRNLSVFCNITFGKEPIVYIRNQYYPKNTKNVFSDNSYFQSRIIAKKDYANLGI